MKLNMLYVNLVTTKKRAYKERRGNLLTDSGNHMVNWEVEVRWILVHLRRKGHKYSNKVSGGIRKWNGVRSRRKTNRGGSRRRKDDRECKPQMSGGCI